jgi:hypothetical protein
MGGNTNELLPTPPGNNYSNYYLVILVYWLGAC